MSRCRRQALPRAFAAQQGPEAVDDSASEDPRPGHQVERTGKTGNRNQSDLDKIEHRYPVVSGEVEKATYIAALERMELGRRNAFYAKVEADSDLVARAVNVVKSQ
jgi:hypothetical protein